MPRKLGSKYKRHGTSFKYMKAYIRRNLKKDLAKLERAERSGWYKGSQELQSARRRIRAIYKRYGLDVTKEKVVDNQVTTVSSYHAGKKFQEALKSYGDISAIYMALKEIEGAQKYPAMLHLKRISKNFEEMRDKAILEKLEKGERVSPLMRNLTYENSFDIISRLSQEFHEVFAFMTYNEVLTAVAEGNNTMEELLMKYHEKISDFELTDKQSAQAMKIHHKESQYFNDAKKLHKIRYSHMIKKK